MGVETRIGLRDQPAIEPPLTATGFITSAQDQRLTMRIKCKGKTPHTIGGIEPQLLHVRVFRAVERVHAGSAKLRPESLQQFHMGQQLILNLHSEIMKLRDEGVVQFHRPRHNVLWHTVHM